LSSSSHLPLKLYSNCMKPVTLSPGRANFDDAGSDRILHREHDRHCAGRLLQRPPLDGWPRPG
jgi:hypothetical protein